MASFWKVLFRWYRASASNCYFHLVFTLPGAIADIAYQNKRLIYGLLFKASAEAMLTIAADPKHLGAKIAITSVLHTWESAMTHHPHVHMIVPGGGISNDGQRWLSCRAKFFLPVRVLSRLFRRLFLDKLAAAYKAGLLKCFGKHIALADKAAFEAYLKPHRKSEWVVYAKAPFGGPEAVLAYLSRYTHRVAISNRRLIKLENGAVTLTCKDYRKDGPDRHGTMSLPAAEFIRRFLLHVLPRGFHRIRHYGLFANSRRAGNWPWPGNSSTCRQKLSRTLKSPMARTWMRPICPIPVQPVVAPWRSSNASSRAMRRAPRRPGRR
ncbi:MAG: transposase [Alphaproteobacteria bacterium]|nr:transposase [Alphaproteobacteria bacterium]